MLLAQALPMLLHSAPGHTAFASDIRVAHAPFEAFRDQEAPTNLLLLILRRVSPGKLIFRARLSRAQSFGKSACCFVSYDNSEFMRRLYRSRSRNVEPTAAKRGRELVGQFWSDDLADFREYTGISL